MNQHDINLVAKVCKDMEPIPGEAMSYDVLQGVQITALISIAISLKRIADQTDKGAHPS